MRYVARGNDASSSEKMHRYSFNKKTKKCTQCVNSKEREKLEKQSATNNPKTCLLFITNCILETRYLVDQFYCLFMSTNKKMTAWLPQRNSLPNESIIRNMEVLLFCKATSIYAEYFQMEICNKTWHPQFWFSDVLSLTFRKRQPSRRDNWTSNLD